MKQNKKIDNTVRRAYLKGLINGILISAAVVATAFAAPRAKTFVKAAVKHLSESYENDGYYHDHIVMDHLAENLREYKGPHDAQYHEMEKTLDSMKKQHEKDRSNIRCWNCDEKEGR